MNSKIRTILIALIAAGSFASAGIAPVAAQAKQPEDLEKAGYTCEKAGDDFIVCTDAYGHEWYCNHEGCGQVKLQVVTSPVTLKDPPVITKARVTVTSLRLAA